MNILLQLITTKLYYNNEFVIGIYIFIENIYSTNKLLFNEFLI